MNKHTHLKNCFFHTKFWTTLFFGFLVFQGTAQKIIEGQVIDSLTGRPIEGAAVFFDQTSLWTITDESGHFRMEIQTNTKVPLLVSFLGYEQEVVKNPFDDKNKTVLLQRAKNELAPVTIKASRQKKRSLSRSVANAPNLKKFDDLFRSLFIGKGKAAERTKIKNPEMLRFLYDSLQNVVSVYSEVPLVIENNYLKYRIIYTLDTASIAYAFNEEFNMLIPKIFVVAGKSFFQDLLDPSKNNKRFYKRRDEAYYGSVLHFMRTLKKNDFRAEGFSVFDQDSIQISHTSGQRIGKAEKLGVHFEIIPRKGFTEIIPPPKFTIIYHNQWSEVYAKQNFGIDGLGNYFPWNAVKFSGFLGRTGISSMLPLNFLPKTDPD